MAITAEKDHVKLIDDNLSAKTLQKSVKNISEERFGINIAVNDKGIEIADVDRNLIIKDTSNDMPHEPIASVAQKL